MPRNKERYVELTAAEMIAGGQKFDTILIHDLMGDGKTVKLRAKRVSVARMRQFQKEVRTVQQVTRQTELDPVNKDGEPNESYIPVNELEDILREDYEVDPTPGITLLKEVYVNEDGTQKFTEDDVGELPLDMMAMLIDAIQDPSARSVPGKASGIRRTRR